MMQTGGDDGSSGEQSVWDETDTAFTWVDFEDVCHNGFTIGGCSLIENEEIWAMADHYSFAMGRAQMLGDEGVTGILDGTDEVDARATVQSR